MTPLVTSVTAVYLQRNLRPDVTSITLHPPGVIFQKPFSSGDMEIAGFDGVTSDRRAAAATAPGAPSTASSTPPLGRRGYQKGLQTLIWKAEDDNDDDLVYDVLYRREGETAWKALKRGVTDAIFVWDTTSVPNGTYVVKIVASDAPANPPGTALSGERESRAFDIDNTPPVIDVTAVHREGTRTTVSFTVTDDFSSVQRVEYPTRRRSVARHLPEGRDRGFTLGGVRGIRRGRHGRASRDPAGGGCHEQRVHDASRGGEAQAVSDPGDGSPVVVSAE